MTGLRAGTSTQKAYNSADDSTRARRTERSGNFRENYSHTPIHQEKGKTKTSFPGQQQSNQQKPAKETSKSIGMSFICRRLHSTIGAQQKREKKCIALHVHNMQNRYKRVL